ncbi:MAG TPA: hypothetical protein VE441_11395, partial [Mycobacterium sp.]|nr:hypothetical protein [Mycobacterium sp.]
MAERETMTGRGSSGDPGAPLPPPRVGGESVDPASSDRDVEFREHTVVGSAQPLGTSPLDDAPPVFGAGSTAGGRPPGGKIRIGDRLFHGFAAGSGAFVVILIALVAIFLIAKAAPAIADDKVNFLFSREWSVDGPQLRFGVVDLLWVTVIISLLAMVIAVPIAIG